MIGSPIGSGAQEGEGTHEGCTYGWMTWARGGGHPRGRAPTRGAHTVGLFGRAGEGTHEGCPYGWIICAHGGGHPRGGVPLRLDDVGARGRAPTRGALRLDGVGARGRAPTRGAPTVGLRGARGGRAGGGHPRGVHIRLDYLRGGARAGEGTHEGCTYGWAPTRGAHTVGWRGRAGEGTHEGCPYGWIICARGEGTHEGWPCGWIIRARARGGGHPRGVPLRLGYQTS